MNTFSQKACSQNTNNKMFHVFEAMNRQLQIVRWCRLFVVSPFSLLCKKIHETFDSAQIFHLSKHILIWNRPHLFIPVELDVYVSFIMCCESYRGEVEVLVNKVISVLHVSVRCWDEDSYSRFGHRLYFNCTDKGSMFDLKAGQVKTNLRFKH